MTYTYHRAHSPNTDARTVPRPARLVVLHWWGNPARQDPWAIIRHLSDPAPGGNPVRAVSAHAVIWPGHVAQLLDYRARSWANGHDQANNTAITIECDPNDPVATMATIIDYLADLITAGELTPDFALKGHRDYTSTECPGIYYQWLPTIRANAIARTQEELDMAPITYTTRDGRTVTEPAEVVLKWVIGNQHEILDDLDAIKAALKPISVEAEWLPPNFAGLVSRLETIAARLEASK